MGTVGTVVVTQAGTLGVCVAPDSIYTGGDTGGTMGRLCKDTPGDIAGGHRSGLIWHFCSVLQPFI